MPQVNYPLPTCRLKLCVHGLPTQSELASYAPQGTPTALLASMGAVAYAKAAATQAPFYMLWWSDSKAIADKVALAKKLGLRGVAVFKMDGGEDQAAWTSLKRRIRKGSHVYEKPPDEKSPGGFVVGRMIPLSRAQQEGRIAGIPAPMHEVNISRCHPGRGG